MRVLPKMIAAAIGLAGPGFGCQSSIPAKPGSGNLSGASGMGGGNAQGGNGKVGGTSALPSESLTLQSATAHVDGRRGNRVRLSISGAQAPNSFAYVAVTAFGSSGNALQWFSTKHDARFDSATGYLVPRVLPSDATFQFDMLVPFTNALLNWAQAKVVLFDRASATSNELSIAVESQLVKSKGQTCDPLAKSDRCDTRLECSATSSTCVDHTGPILSQVGYWTTTNGAIVVATGRDNADDVAAIELSFLDANGSQVQVDLNNDPTNPHMASEFVESAGISMNDGQLAFRIAPADSFTDVVKNLGLVPVDAIGTRGTSMTAALQPQPSRGSGAPCDINGFNYCSGNSACVPGLPDASNSCQPLSSAQSAECKSAQVVDSSEANVSAAGYNSGTSLWDPPADCAPDIALHQPESVIKLHVPIATTSLTLSTDRPETQIDTVLYVLSACGTSSPTVLGCNDDSAVGNFTSAVTLTNVAAGDYYVIVDSMSNEGGPFGLTMTSQ